MLKSTFVGIAANFRSRSAATNLCASGIDSANPSSLNLLSTTFFSQFTMSGPKTRASSTTFCSVRVSSRPSYLPTPKPPKDVPPCPQPEDDTVDEVPEHQGAVGEDPDFH